jgi:type III secretion protein J
MRKQSLLILFFILPSLFFSCSGGKDVILNNLSEKDANVIIVFLSSKGILASKISVASTGAGSDSSAAKFNLEVPSNKSVEAMALLNQNGLPQKQGTTLLDLFGKSSFMSTDKEETIRYQAGLSQQIANVISMIDGVIYANVQLSFPDSGESLTDGGVAQKPTAAVFVKHQGVMDEPNNHLVLKIKRLVSGSVQNLSIDDVTVVSDKSRFTDVSPSNPLTLYTASHGDEQVKIWSIIMNKSSTGKFRLFFFFLMVIVLLLATALGWLVWKIYPILRSGDGFKKLLTIAPFSQNIQEPQLPQKPSSESTSNES